MKATLQRTFIALVLLGAAALAAAGLRLAPYSLGESSALTPWLWNLAPVLAMFVFGVAVFRRPEFGLAAPLLLLVGTDWLLHRSGMAPTTLADRANVYVAYMAVGLLGLLLKTKRTWKRFAAVCLAGPLGFWLWTNAVHWLGTDLYPKTAAGLAECYAAALPFLRNDLIGTTFFLGALFGGYGWLTKAVPEPAPAAPAALAPVTTSG